MIPCLKQTTRCVIVLADGGRFEAVNLCDVDGAGECPRLIAGSRSGEDYGLCGSTHAEANAAALVPEHRRDLGGTALLYGHDWFCGPCQHALLDSGINRFVITGKPA